MNPDATSSATSSGEAPRSGEAPCSVQVPSSGQALSSGQAPSSGEAPRSGQAPSSGEAPRSGQAPTSAQPPSSDQAPSSGQVPSSGQAPDRQRRLLGSLQEDPEEPASDESEDSSWDPDSEDADNDSAADVQAEELSDSDSSDGVPMDGRIILNDEDLHDRVVQLITEGGCDDKCLQGKAAELQNFLCSLSYMTSQEKKQSVLTSLAMMMKTNTALRRRGTGVRMTIAYYLPLVGRVCRDTWTSVYSVSTATITRYRRQIQSVSFSVKPHGGAMNLNASKIDIRWLVKWFRSFATTLGDVVPVRVRTQKTIDGVVCKQYTNENYTLLPAYFTWDQLYTGMHNYVLENEMDVREPRPSTFRRILLECCPTVRVRSPRSNVCDLCSIMFSKMRSGVTSQLTEDLGVHTAAAKEMR
ncbi:hypothetical protein PR002_g26753 [Phytophthora rubi]|uniref:Uncharacterized protein n=1 Tax=Phytophthora rubi TaxID=129364 RepID=A0A6A3HMN5_9STRA|nr:hypothetical protein PR002_g26753 [Phytophthora rubi]